MNAKSLHGWDKASKLYSTFQGNGSKLKQRKKKHIIAYNEVHVVPSKVRNLALMVGCGTKILLYFPKKLFSLKSEMKISHVFP